MIDSKKLFNELKERGLMFDVSGDFYEVFKKPTTFYVGTDSTGDSLHVGHLLAFTTAKLLQSYGHKPIVLVGSFTAKVGDPSFRDTSRPMISDEQISYNTRCIKKQIQQLLDFDSSASNKAILVDNDSWLGNMPLSQYMKDVTKLITVNSMLSRESVKKRLNREGDGMTLCEMLYQTFQGYDFLHLYREYGCVAELGGSDQWANCLVGQEFIRKTLGKTDTCVLTWPLVTRADGTKFGKSSNGNNVWLDPNKTSSYEFYQFWLNQSDADSESFIKKFTLIPLDEINKMIEKHRENPSKRLLQKTLAEYMTEMIHGKDALNGVEQATEFLFGGSDINDIDDNAWKFIKSEVSTIEVSKDTFADGMSVIDLANMHEKVPSKSEARKLIKSNGFSVNKVKVGEKDVINTSNFINGKYLLLTKGKKDHCLVVVG